MANYRFSTGFTLHFKLYSGFYVPGYKCLAGYSFQKFSRIILLLYIPCFF